MTVFFSVDVETANLTPWGTDGFLLTIGAVAVDWNPALRQASNGAEFYVRIDRSEDLDPWWYGGDSTPAPHDTAKWWSEQATVPKNEAWLDRTLVRHSDATAARMFAEFVLLNQSSDGAFFVANPVAFDKMWIDSLFGETGVENPFHYRSLCLRSMRFGLDARSPWGSSREDHDPEIPHHALHDARAQAEDLKMMLIRRDR